MLETDYQIVLIIITIIGFIISTAFYVYFVYIPTARAETKIDTISAQGLALLDLVNQRINEAEGATTEALTGLCQSFATFITDYNCNSTFTGCPSCPTGLCCLLSQEAYPQFCNSLVPFPAQCCSFPYG